MMQNSNISQIKVNFLDQSFSTVITDVVTG